MEQAISAQPAGLTGPPRTSVPVGDALVRIDGAHPVRNRGSGESQLVRDDDESGIPIRPPAPPVSSRVRGAIVFGVFVFLCGQIIQFCGFVAGQFTIWSVGNLCTIGGVCFAFLSVAEAFRRNQQQLDQILQQDLAVKKRSRLRRFVSARR